MKRFIDALSFKNENAVFGWWAVMLGSIGLFGIVLDILRAVK